MTRLPPDFHVRMRAAAEKRRDAEARVAQAQRRRMRKPIAAGCWRSAERARRA